MAYTKWLLSLCAACAIVDCTAAFTTFDTLGLQFPANKIPTPEEIVNGIARQYGYKQAWVKIAETNPEKIRVKNPPTVMLLPTHIADTDQTARIGTIFLSAAQEKYLRHAFILRLILQEKRALGDIENLNQSDRDYIDSLYKKCIENNGEYTRATTREITKAHDCLAAIFHELEHLKQLDENQHFSITQPIIDHAFLDKHNVTINRPLHPENFYYQDAHHSAPFPQKLTNTSLNALKVGGAVITAYCATAYLMKRKKVAQFTKKYPRLAKGLPILSACIAWLLLNRYEQRQMERAADAAVPDNLNLLNACKNECEQDATTPDWRASNPFADHPTAYERAAYYKSRLDDLKIG